MHTPCANLIERDPPECAMSRKVPEDCHRACAHYSPGLTDSERTRCEIWSRVMGYFRPVQFWNTGKQQEHRDRKYFKEMRE